MSIDTSNMSKGKADALEIAEAARDEMNEKSLAGGLFVGELNLNNASPFPQQDLYTKIMGEVYLREFWSVMETIDANESDNTGEIPQEVFDKLASIGAVALKIPHKYGIRYSVNNITGFPKETKKLQYYTGDNKTPILLLLKSPLALQL